MGVLVSIAGIAVSTGAVQAQTFEFPETVEAALADFEACLAEATTLATPEMVPDPEVRETVFQVLIDSCNRFRELDLETIALRNSTAEIEAQIATMTANLISGAKAELGLD